MFKSLVTEVLGVGVDPEQQGASLKDYEWRSRVLIIFSDEEGTEAGRQVSLLLARPDALRERDLVVLEIAGGLVRGLYGAADELSAEAIRADCDVAPGFFSLVLVGKDGSIKLRNDHVTPPDEIFARIDSMPMRRAEAQH